MQLEKTQLLWRFRSVEGHLRAVIGMVEQDQPNEQVVYQLLAIRGSVDRLLELLIRQRVERCLDALIHETCPERQALEINHLVNLYQYSRKQFYRR